MARLTIPSPQIDLYNDGFEPHDKLERSGTGKKLSKIIEIVDDPIVLAVDGDWGSGKSFFLKCWVGQHVKDYPETSTVYFDAFEHDYLDEPLVALTQAIIGRLPNDANSKSFIRKGKKFAAKFAMPGARIAGAMTTGGLTEIAAPFVDSAITSTWKEAEKAAEQFWSRESGRSLAIMQFRESLKELTKSESGDLRKLVVVIDELDRCRPDYALTLLETIRHFFNVDGVHFVLGTNIEELQNCVKARYGASIDAKKYLQKFVDVVLPLRGRKVKNSGQSTFIKHFRNTASAMDLDHSWQTDWLHSYLKFVDHHVGVSLRDVEKILQLSVVAPAPAGRGHGTSHQYIGLLILRILRPNLFEKARNGHLTTQEVREVFTFFGNTSAQQADFVWTHSCAYDGTNSRPNDYSQQKDELFGISVEIRSSLREVVASSFDTFDVSGLV